MAWLRGLLLGTTLIAACAPVSFGEPTPSPPPSSAPASPTASASLAPTAAGTPSPLATRAFAVDPSARWPVVLYDGRGGVIRQRTEAGEKQIARPCAEIQRLEARPVGLLASCLSAAAGNVDLYRVSLPDGNVTRIASDVLGTWLADISPDGRTAAAFRRGDCSGPAPVCQTRVVLIDVTSKTEREVLPSGYHLGARLEWTALGLTLFQPECAEAGCVGPGDRSGTFVWDGSALKKWDDLRFVARSGDWTLLERLRSFSDRSDQRTAIIRGPRGDRVLSAGHALAISDTGESLVWTPGPEVLTRFAPDGRALWQASLSGELVRAIGSDALLVSSAGGDIEIYDVRRMLRFTPSLNGFAVAAIAR